LIPHSHQDAGWYKSPDEYFAGGGTFIHASSKTVLYSTMDEVAKDPKRRFTIADIKYLTMWYKNLK
jgi:hypothetical protein